MRHDKDMDSYNMHMNSIVQDISVYLTHLFGNFSLHKNDKTLKEQVKATLKTEIVQNISVSKKRLELLLQWTDTRVFQHDLFGECAV